MICVFKQAWDNKHVFDFVPDILMCTASATVETSSYIYPILQTIWTAKPYLLKLYVKFNEHYVEFQVDS